MREEKKYEVLPGVEIPDMKRIQEAASDFSVSDVGDVEIKTVTLQPVVKAVSAGVSDEDLSQLQNLGNKVAEDEARAKAESRAKMDKIMHNVKAPESMTDLKKSHIEQVDAEKRKEIEESLKAEEQQKAEEDAKAKAREERRQLQQRLLEESRERAAKLKAEKERLDKALDAKAEMDRTKQEKLESEASTAKETASSETKQDAAGTKTAEKNIESSGEKTADKSEEKAAEAAKIAEKAAEKPVEKPAEPAVKKTATVVSDAEAFDDFKEFLEDDQ